MKEMTLEYDEDVIKCPECSNKLRGIGVTYFTAIIYPVEVDEVMEIEFTEDEQIETTLTALDCEYCHAGVNLLQTDVLLVPPAGDEK